ncbi:MAG: FG-GAP repeat protein, partial [Deltaproteobacteria bacterium]|nr:FG-GAP repeat protein [Deltaproteobacteria bacterium]
MPRGSTILFALGMVIASFSVAFADGTTLPAAPSWWSHDGDEAASSYGNVVSSAGDVNGDGYDDVIVGAPDWNGDGSKIGRAFVYLGSAAGLAATPHVVYEGALDNEPSFGRSVSRAGDVNGDGYDDVIVGEGGTVGDGSKGGAAKVYLGSASGLTAGDADWTVIGDHAGDFFGISLSGAGDVNGDGYDDVMIGASAYSKGQGNEGAAFVYFGSKAGLSSIPDWSDEPDAEDARMGSVLRSVGDVNDDGYDDIIVGAPDYSSSGNDEDKHKGMARVYYGSETGPSADADWTYVGGSAYLSFASSVAGAGDVNGDGYDDVIVGSHLYEEEYPNEGAAFVFLGSKDGLSAEADWSDRSGVALGHFGVSVAPLGDVNDDGYDDVVIGATGTGVPRISVYLGSADGLSTDADWTLDEMPGMENLGLSVAGAGDVNGDGWDDLLAGDSGFGVSDETTEHGAVFLFLAGQSTVTTTTAGTTTTTTTSVPTTSSTTTTTV